jgi:hypothetical protein
VLKNHGFISLDVYKCLEQEVFAKYIHSFGKNQELPLNESRYELQSLLDEYKPDYTHNYWEALIKSELKVNSDYTKQVIGILKRHYLYLAHQIAPEPQMLLGMLNSKSIYPPKCEPDLLIAKFAVILSEFYTEADLDHNDILNQLIQMRMSIGIYHVPNTNYIDIITINIYTNYTNYRFQLNKTVIEKIINQLSDFIQRPLTIDNYSDILVVLSIILEKYCDRVSGKQIMLGYLTELFTSNDNMLTSDTLEMCIINTNLSTEYISSALDGTEYTINIGKNETTGQICLKIRPVNILIETIQKTRWRNWCAKRHIPFSTQNLELLADPDTNEFICPITLEPQKKGDIIINLVGCRHKFSAAGIIEWSRTKDTCPVCRAKLADGKLYGANCEMLELIK